MSLFRWALALGERFCSRSLLWGDGFENDSLRHFASVETWDEVSDDEFLRLYPRLVDEAHHPRLLDHVERCVATLCRQCGSAAAAGLRSTDADRVDVLARKHMKVWSPAPTPAYLNALARGEFRALDDVFLSLRSGDQPAYEPALAELFAYHTAVHPAYFWPEAVATHQRLTTFAWLGVVMRGRSALMPYDVAEYLLERDCDSDLAIRLGTTRAAEQCQRQARLRIQGREVIAPGKVHYFLRRDLVWSAT